MIYYLLKYGLLVTCIDYRLSLVTAFPFIGAAVDLLNAGASELDLFPWISLSNCSFVSWTVLFLKSFLLDFMVGVRIKVLVKVLFGMPILVGLRYFVILMCFLSLFNAELFISDFFFDFYDSVLVNEH